MSNKEMMKNKVFIRTFGCKMAAMLHTDFTIIGRRAYEGVS
jgi:hypothetical protein